MNTGRILFSHKTYVLLIVAVCLFASTSVSAITITQLTVDPQNDFVLEPGKREVILSPGETVTEYISITNRIEKTINFRIEIEDFMGSEDKQQPVVLLGSGTGPYSLKNFISPEVNEFQLQFGERATMPVTISIPEDAEPGGFYGSVIVSNVPDADSANSGAGARLVSRLGALFLVRVSGPVEEGGELTDFKILGPDRMIHSKNPTGFEIQFKNTGSVHLVPYGQIQVKNMLGKVVTSLPVDAYFALPESTRYRDVFWNSGKFLIGRYSADLSLYPGYGDTTLSRSISFWVIPWKVVIPTVATIVILVSLIYYIATRFEFRRKQD